MDKSEILRMFLDKGYQIDVETLDFFSKNENSLQKFFSEIEKKSTPSTITLDFVETMLQSDVVIFSLNRENKKLTAEDLAKSLLERLSIIKKILVTHMDLVNLLSINKISQKTKKFSLIGIVLRNDYSTQQITVADDTGEIDMRIDKKSSEEIQVNDVLGFVCEKDDIVRVKNVVFPDVPLRRNIKALVEEKNAVFAEKTNDSVLKWCAENKNQIYLFTFTHHDDLSEIPANVRLVFCGDGPTFANVSKMFSIFFFDGSFLKDLANDKKFDDFLVLQFRKRYFNATKKFDKIFINNAFVLENIPDAIVVRGLGEAVQTNYKGTSLLSVTEDTAWVISLKTREIIKLSSP